MKWFNGWSMNRKLATMTVVLAAVYVTLGLCLMQKLVEKWKQDDLASFNSYSDQMSAAIAAQFYERYGDIQAIATNGNLLSKDPSIVQATLNTYVGLYGIYDTFLYVDPKGNFISASNATPDGKTIDLAKLQSKNYSDTPWFKAAIAEKYTVDKDKGFSGSFVEDAQIDSITSEVYAEKKVGNSFSTVVKGPDGKITGVITARAGFRWVEYEFAKAMQRFKDHGWNNSQIALFNSDGIMVVNANPKTYDKEYKWDFNTIFTKKLSEAFPELAKVKPEEQGVGFYQNGMFGAMHAVAYRPVSDKKFIDSIGWRVFVSSDEQELVKEVVQAKQLFLVTFLILGFFGNLFCYWFTRKMAIHFSELSHGIGREAEQLNGSAANMNKAAGELADCISSQASAVQETVSAIDEVSAMVSKSADSAAETLNLARESKEVAEKGNEAVRQMLTSMDEIQGSNKSIMERVETSNQQITSIVSLINEIGQKTKVINDIVFQTKLLSFNASVEAARAGEHGKGFAVVAEEVGNLAQMSGNAAKEITQMLENSIRQVEQIANETKSKVSGLMEVNKEKVNSGFVHAKRCAEILSEIVDNVGKVGTMSSEIAQASKEQAIGVSEITKAMNKLGEISNQNSASTNQALSIAKELNSQASILKNYVKDLDASVEGENAPYVNRPAPVYSPKVEKPVAKPSNPVSSEGGKVFEFKRDIAPHAEPAAPKLKMASGGSHMSSNLPMPSSNDSRFEEV